MAVSLSRAARRGEQHRFVRSLPLRPCGYHWHLEVAPTLTKAAGFEAGTGFFIDPTPPEEAAELLRRLEL